MGTNLESLASLSIQVHPSLTRFQLEGAFNSSSGRDETKIQPPLKPGRIIVDYVKPLPRDFGMRSFRCTQECMSVTSANERGKVSLEAQEGSYRSRAVEHAFGDKGVITKVSDYCGP